MTHFDSSDSLSTEVHIPTTKKTAPSAKKLLRMLPYLLILCAGLGIGYFLGRSVSAEEITLSQYLMDDDPIQGKETAQITIIEFADYDCSYCKQWNAEIWPQLQTAYPEKIRLVYRDFPLIGLHENAVPAAEAANCAGEQGSYWAYHDLLFQNQGSLSEEKYAILAGNLGLSISAFNTCLVNQTYAAEVEADFQEAITLGLTGTPTFFINGYRVEGVHSIENFQEIIDQILSLET